MSDRPRSLQPARDRRGRVLLPRRDGRAPALPGLALPPACADQGRQSRSRARRARASSARGRAAGGAEARRALGARAAFERERGAADRRPRFDGGTRPNDLVRRARSRPRRHRARASPPGPIAAREVFSAVVGYVAYGLLLAIVWVRLYAPDVALTEAAIGSGVTGVLLVAASARLGRLPTPEAPPGAALKVAAAALSILVAGVLAAAVLYPSRSRPLARARGRQGTRRDRPRQRGHGRPDRLSLVRHDAREGRARARGRRRMVGRAGPVLGRRAGAARSRRAGRRARLPRPHPGADRRRDRRPDVLGRRGRSGRRLPGRRDPRRHVDHRDDGPPDRAAADRRGLASTRADLGARGVPARRSRGAAHGRELLRLSRAASPNRSSCSSKPSWCCRSR